MPTTYTINDWNPAIIQTQGTLRTLDSLATPGNTGAPGPITAIRVQCGQLTTELQNLNTILSGILANPAISNQDKTLFMRQAYLDLSAIFAEMIALTALLRLLFTEGGVFLFESETNLYNQTGFGIVQNYTAAAPGYGLGGIAFPAQPT